MIVKYCKPSRFESSPEGTVVRVMDDLCSSYKYYVQISEYKDSPNWVTWDYFLGLILKDLALDKEFVAKCLDVFKAKNQKDNAKLKSNIADLVDKMNL